MIIIKLKHYLYTKGIIIKSVYIIFIILMAFFVLESVQIYFLLLSYREFPHDNFQRIRLQVLAIFHRP